MRYIWFFMMAGSLAILCFTAPEKAVSSLTCSAATSLEISLKLAGVYCLWLGVINVLKQSGAVGALSKKMQPLIKKLFKTQNDETTQNISINVSANLLGVGNAATPMGIRAMQALDDKTGKANFAMIMLVVINATSIQLLPTTVIGLRASAGSENPADIILPTLIVTVTTTIMGILLVHGIEKLRKKIKGKKKE